MFMYCVDAGAYQPGWWGNRHVNGLHVDQSDTFAFLVQITHDIGMSVK